MRRRAREAALGVLFQMDVGKLPLDEALAAARSEEWARDDWTLIVTLARGTREHLSEIDALIGGVAEHWTLERMAAVDRNILRMAVFELRHTATPVGVVINEAVELAKRYSTEESGRFVNGLLGEAARSAGPPPASPGPCAEEMRCAGDPGLSDAPAPWRMRGIGPQWR